jgi:iron complex outermembrane receptor protein
MVWNMLSGFMEGNVSALKGAITSRIFPARIGSSLVLSLTLLAGEAFGQSSQPMPRSTAQPAAQRDLSQLTIEDLMNIEVTSVSKKEQKMSRAAAAIFVITPDEISRSGATNIPDLLRMVPGLDVSQINANNWAVSARGFNRQFENKLLVLIDGRAVYTPLDGGVNWDTQDVPLEDIDRIEVIRGPGATLWGANAVNGVINILTKKAADTQGGLVTGGGGSEGQAYGTVRYGGTIRGNTSYRVFTKYVNQSSLSELDGRSGDDLWHRIHAGFRVDSNISSNDVLTLQGDLYNDREGATIVHIFSINPPVTGALDTQTNLSGGNILGRWSHIFSRRSDTTFQFYFDKYTRGGPEAGENRGTIDFDFNHHLAWGSRQDLVWGAGYRRSRDRTLGTIDQTYNPSNESLQLFNFFAQDTIALKPDRLFLTIGSKVENSYFTGFGIEPSVRLAWALSDRTTLWSAVSRAQRSPARGDAGLQAGLAVFPDPGGSSTPVEVILFGNRQIKSEYLVAYEAGVRAEPNTRFSVDVSSFFNHYDHLESEEPGPEVFDPNPAPGHFVMPLVFQNLMYGTTEGVELAANLKLTNRWKLSSGYSFLEMHLHTKPASQDTVDVPDFEGSNPQHQAQLRSHIELSHGLAWDANAYFVTALPFQQVPSYTRIDTLLTWKPAERSEFSLVGQNLVHDHHMESQDIVTLVNSSLIKRSVYAKFTWRFF